MKNQKLNKRKIYVIQMVPNSVYFTGDGWDLKPVLFNQVEARKMLFKCQKLMADKSTALKGSLKPAIKRWDYLTNGLGDQTKLNLKP